MNETLDTINQNILRGNKFEEYTIEDPVDSEFYSGEIWNPSENDNKLTGKFIDVLEDVGRYQQKMYILDTDRLDGKYDKVFGYTSLDRQMKEITIGTVIKIEYLGKKTGKNQNIYNEYKVSRLRKQ